MKTLVIISIALIAFTFGCKSHRDGKAPTNSDCNGANTHSWEAWNNVMPGADKSFHVIGKAKVNSGGWKASLVKRVPQGINPEILLLDLTITPPTGNVIKPILNLDLDYSEKPATGKYTRVQVFCGEKLTADLPVKDIH
jgi:hypothetical protein